MCWPASACPPNGFLSPMSARAASRSIGSSRGWKHCPAPETTAGRTAAGISPVAPHRAECSHRVGDLQRTARVAAGWGCRVAAIRGNGPDRGELPSQLVGRWSGCRRSCRRRRSRGSAGCRCPRRNGPTRCRPPGDVCCAVAVVVAVGGLLPEHGGEFDPVASLDSVPVWEGRPCGVPRRGQLVGPDRVAVSPGLTGEQVRVR
jgi:hypothetical protein